VPGVIWNGGRRHLRNWAPGHPVVGGDGVVLHEGMMTNPPPVGEAPTLMATQASAPGH